MKIPLVIPTYNRPQYLAPVLNALRLCDNLDLFKLYTSEEPECPEVHKLFSQVDFMEIERHINPTRYKLEKNVFQAINIGFSNNDFMVLLEEDVVPGKDFLNLCLWANDNYKDDKSIFSISGWNVNKEKLPAGQANLVTKLPKYFHGVGWASWRDRWEVPELQKNIADAVDKDVKGIGAPGWDWQCTFHLRDAVPELYSLRVVLARTRHIGIEGQHIASAEWHKDNIETNCFTDDDPSYFTKREEFKLI